MIAYPPIPKVDEDGYATQDDAVEFVARVLLLEQAKGKNLADMKRRIRKAWEYVRDTKAELKKTFRNEVLVVPWSEFITFAARKFKRLNKVPGLPIKPLPGILRGELPALSGVGSIVVIPPDRKRLEALFIESENRAWSAEQENIRLHDALLDAKKKSRDRLK